MVSMKRVSVAVRKVTNSCQEFAVSFESDLTIPELANMVSDASSLGMYSELLSTQGYMIKITLVDHLGLGAARARIDDGKYAIAYDNRFSPMAKDIYVSVLEQFVQHFLRGDCDEYEIKDVHIESVEETAPKLSFL